MEARSHAGSQHRTSGNAVTRIGDFTPKKVAARAGKFSHSAANRSKLKATREVVFEFSQIDHSFRETERYDVSGDTVDMMFSI